MTPAIEQRAAQQSRFWWSPLVLIAVALILLFAAPFFTGARLQKIRRYVTDVVSPALVHTNDLEAALATEFAARSELAEGGGQSTAAAVAADSAEASIARDQHSLDSLVRRVGPEAVSRFAEARASIAAWRLEEDRFAAEARAGKSAIHGAGAAGTRGRRWETVQLALSNMQLLEDELNARTDEERAQISDLERMSVMVPGGLVPLALLALAAVAWTARRTLLLSHAAESGQRKAEYAMAAKSALMRGVTHDLKNPLGAARGYADLLADGALGPVPDAQAKMIVRLRSLLSATLDTVNDLVELSRADAGELSIERSDADVARIASDCVDDYRAMSQAAGLDLQLKLEAVGPNASTIIKTDPVRVRQVLGNLLSNAVKYTPRGGIVELTVAAERDAELGDVMVLEVCDTGPGIPEPLRERVFEEFFRVPASVAIAPGTGVGLAIARRVARLLGGDLRVRETVGGGATFSLLIPSGSGTARR
ncbi:MAG: HAMP domain-containing sensor histidine kinase [bacterium]